MSGKEEQRSRDLYIIFGPSGSGKTTLMTHIFTTFKKIREKDDSFDHKLLTISDDYAFALDSELVPENINISSNRVYLKEYSYPSIYTRFAELTASEVDTARRNFYSKVIAKAAELSISLEIVVVEGALIQHQKDIDLITKALEADNTEAVGIDLGYDTFAQSPRWEEGEVPTKHRYHELMSRFHVQTNNVLSSFKQLKLPWWPYQAKTMPPEVKFARLGLDKLSPKGKSIVDLCCNEGGIAGLCAKDTEAAKVIGVDHNLMAFIMATHQYHDVEYHLQETFNFLERTPTKKYDIGLLLGSLHYFPQTHLLLTELARVFRTIVIEPVLTDDGYKGDGLLHRNPPYNDFIMTREFFESYTARYFRRVEYHGPSVPPKDGSNRHIYHLHTS